MFALIALVLLYAILLRVTIYYDHRIEITKLTLKTYDAVILLELVSLFSVAVANVILTREDVFEDFIIPQNYN